MSFLLSSIKRVHPQCNKLVILRRFYAEQQQQGSQLQTGFLVYDLWKPEMEQSFIGPVLPVVPEEILEEEIDTELLEGLDEFEDFNVKFSVLKQKEKYNDKNALLTYGRRGDPVSEADLLGMPQEKFKDLYLNNKTEFNNWIEENISTTNPLMPGFPRGNDFRNMRPCYICSAIGHDWSVCPNTHQMRDVIQTLSKRTRKVIPRNNITVESFLKMLGRGCDKHVDQFESFDDLMNAKRLPLKAKGIPVRDRRYILSWTNKYKFGMTPHASKLQRAVRKNRVVKQRPQRPQILPKRKDKKDHFKHVLREHQLEMENLDKEI